MLSLAHLHLWLFLWLLYPCLLVMHHSVYLAALDSYDLWYDQLYDLPGH